MPTALRRSRGARYLPLFPEWSGARPVGWFMIENLLEARRDCGLPANDRGPDEDVNIYLAHLLAARLRAESADEGPALPAATPPLDVPDGGERARAACYLRAGEARLIALGLFGRPDLRSRRSAPWGWDEESARRRALADGAQCYLLASRLLARRGERAAAAIAAKLAARFADYVRVLEALARGRFGLGARLSLAALRELAPGPAAGAAMDQMLDRLLELRRRPTAAAAAAVRAAATHAGVDPSRLAL